MGPATSIFVALTSLTVMTKGGRDSSGVKNTCCSCKRNQVQLPEPISASQLTTATISSSRAPAADALFWPLQALGMHMVHKQTSRYLRKIKTSNKASQFVCNFVSWESLNAFMFLSCPYTIFKFPGGLSLNPAVPNQQQSGQRINALPSLNSFTKLVSCFFLFN